MSVPQTIREWRDVSAERFREEILPQEEPAVLRGLVADWPAVQRGARSASELASYIKTYVGGQPVETFVGDPAIRGRFFYAEGLRGYNFERRREPLASLLDRLVALETLEDAPSTYAGAVIIPECMPGFGAANQLSWAQGVPRIWLGNAITVATHFDLSSNIACVVAGRRRFTLFPPEQLVNLYVGPLEFTLAGPPVSMVDPEAPDLERYPRFAEAWKTARAAELGPGDAIYIPHMWWHHVKSLSPFNVLVNYWWDDIPAFAGSPFDCMIHGLLSIRHLPEARRKVWQTAFNYYIFGTGPDPVAHLPEDQRGVLGELTPEIAQTIKQYLMYNLSRK
ncbi:MAG: cupin-like domain-containing protein [Xanthomonadaceae bacterium]|nr:cupin-like domain-containing protein [Xanthomonadaceae bacterium]